MSDPIDPSATWHDWLSDPDSAFRAVVNHALTVDDWGALSWLAAILTGLGVLRGITRIASRLPVIGPYAAAVDAWLPRLTGKAEAKAQAQAHEVERRYEHMRDAAREGIRAGEHALDQIEGLSPGTARAIRQRLRDWQESLGVREYVQPLLREIRRERADRQPTETLHDAEPTTDALTRSQQP